MFIKDSLTTEILATEADLTSRENIRGSSESFNLFLGLHTIYEGIFIVEPKQIKAAKLHVKGVAMS